ncbi:TerB family tellurite resistance protein [Sporocytophaga myxococcoides]|uniref:TerB family tellurite resistance protein n=1 Tax=Sporocytophaga myxococcoides TaxID=153721 RepID=UPI00048ECA9B|nr:TerB family tellurite resistance protein [Sporocytophaga myxococcoides]
MSTQNIHVAMGSLAYSIAKADGAIQLEEKETIKNLAQREFQLGDSDIEWIDQMFNKLEKANIPLEDAYNYALDTLEANRFHFDFTQSMKSKCISFMERVAEAFNETSVEERSIISRFKKDVQRF